MMNLFEKTEANKLFQALLEYCNILRMANKLCPAQWYKGQRQPTLIIL